MKLLLVVKEEWMKDYEREALCCLTFETLSIVFACTTSYIMRFWHRPCLFTLDSCCLMYTEMDFGHFRMLCDEFGHKGHFGYETSAWDEQNTHSVLLV